MEQTSPWLSIWTQPRATIARITAVNPNRSLWILAAVYGFSSLLGLFQSMALGNGIHPVAIFLFALIGAPFYGYISFNLWSAVVLWIGKLLKGGGHFKSVRAAYAWSCVPIALNIPLWLLMAFLFGHQLFLNFPDAHLYDNSKILALFLILISKVVLAIWSLVIYLNALAEVQKFSILKSILNVVLAGLILSVIFFGLWSFLFYVLGPN